MVRWLALAAVVACACPSKPTQPPGGGTGSGVPPPIPGGAACEGLRPKLERLYRAEAQVKEPKRVEDAVADNTTMVLNDCAKAPAKVIACVDAAATIAELEARCLRPFDDEGSEGMELDHCRISHDYKP